MRESSNLMDAVGVTQASVAGLGVSIDLGKMFSLQADANYEIRVSDNPSISQSLVFVFFNIPLKATRPALLPG